MHQLLLRSAELHSTRSTRSTQCGNGQFQDLHFWDGHWMAIRQKPNWVLHGTHKDDKTRCWLLVEGCTSGFTKEIETRHHLLGFCLMQGPQTKTGHCHAITWGHLGSHYQLHGENKSMRGSSQIEAMNIRFWRGHIQKVWQISSISRSYKMCPFFSCC